MISLPHGPHYNYFKVLLAGKHKRNIKETRTKHERNINKVGYLNLVTLIVKKELLNSRRSHLRDASARRGWEEWGEEDE